ncbi:hypothetical protein HU200_056756 [Digitaria exilis]|uniref:Reverse transcriptase zinc-binding domain-containing protein n=1 Tax=Digitaria exilis TaxID=1010633 RepID=A0A835AGR8_9POAL|nr:hypothetical protein HU200_056756 [Digitaria exilis]
MHLDTYVCVCCVDHIEEDIIHLFFECPFSQACWIYLGIEWDTTINHQLMFLRAREKFGSIIFREIIILPCGLCGCTGTALSLMGLLFPLMPGGDEIGYPEG